MQGPLSLHKLKSGNKIRTRQPTSGQHDGSYALLHPTRGLVRRVCFVFLLADRSKKKIALFSLLRLPLTWRGRCLFPMPDHVHVSCILPNQMNMQDSDFQRKKQRGCIHGDKNYKKVPYDNFPTKNKKKKKKRVYNYKVRCRDLPKQAEMKRLRKRLGVKVKDALNQSIRRWKGLK